MARATLNGAVIAESDHTEVVEGNHYFRPSSVNKGHLRGRRTETSFSARKTRRVEFSADFNGEGVASTSAVG